MALKLLNLKELLILFSCCIAVSSARLAYTFSDGYLEVLGSEPTEAFDCEGRPYGYYADTANECKVFHVCLPVLDFDEQVITTYQYSFFCGNQTVFSQDSLTCSHPENALPCSEAESYYEAVNSEFGRIPDDNLVRKK